MGWMGLFGVWLIVIVNSRFLQRPEKQSRGNSLIHRRCKISWKDETQVYDWNANGWQIEEPEADDRDRKRSGELENSRVEVVNGWILIS